MDGTTVKRIGNALCSVGLSASVALFAGESLAQSETGQAVPGDTTRVLRWQTAREHPVLTAIDLQPNGRLIAAAGDTHSIHIWDRQSGEAKWELKGHSDWVRSLAISPDGRTLVSGGNDGRVLLWDLQSGAIQATLDERDAAVRAVSFGHSGTTVAVAAFGEPLRIFHVDTKDQLFQLDCPCQDIGAVAFANDDWRIAAGGRNGRIRVWNLKEANQFVDYRPHGRRVRDICFLADGSVLSCGDDGRIVRGGVEMEHETIAEVNTRLFCLAAIDEESVVCGGADNLVRQFRLNDGRRLETFRGHQGTVAAISINAESIATCSFDTTVRLWPREQADQDRAIETSAPAEIETQKDGQRNKPTRGKDNSAETVTDSQDGGVSTAKKVNRIEPRK